MVEYWIVEICVKEKFSRHALDCALNELHLLNLANINANITSQVVLKLVTVVTDTSCEDGITLYSEQTDLTHFPQTFSLLITQAETFREYCLNQQVQAEIHFESNRYRAEGLCNIVKTNGGVRLFMDAKKKVFQLRKNKTIDYCIYHLPSSCTLYKVLSSKKAEAIVGKGASFSSESYAYSPSNSSQSSITHSLSTSANESHATSYKTVNDDTDVFSSPSTLLSIPDSSPFDSHSISSRASASISLTSSLYSAPSHPSSASSSGDYFQAEKPPLSSSSSTSLLPRTLLTESITVPSTAHCKDVIVTETASVSEPDPEPASRFGIDIDPSGLDMKLLCVELKRVQEEAKEAEKVAKKAMDDTLLLQKQTNILRKEAADALSTAMVKSQRQEEERDVRRRWKVDFRNFQFSVLAEACNYFEKENVLGEGRTGTVYRGKLEHINVAVKLFMDNPVAFREFNEQIETQSSIRHPNTILILGYCSEPTCLVYEFLDNGTLWHRLLTEPVRKNAPLTWNVRLNVLINVCQALVHLHNRDPPILSIDLHPSNILLDQNYNAKLKMVYSQKDKSTQKVNPLTSHSNSSLPLLSTSSSSSSSSSLALITCMDKTPLSTSSSLTNADASNLNPSCPDSERTLSVWSKPEPPSDLYSLGSLILDLLMGIRRHSTSTFFLALDHALSSGLEEQDALKSFWDASAGNWPPHIAMELARLAKESMQYREKEKENCISLMKEIMPVLMRLKEDADSVMEEERRKHENVKRLAKGVPFNFLCPITWELMEEPVIASDGHTYERIAIVEWLKDHNISPKTGLILPNKQVMANHVMHSMIEEWKELHPSLIV